ncbi:hypothetical protein YPPY89_3589, partial [Yersinia pestis PY-89]
MGVNFYIGSTLSF